MSRPVYKYVPHWMSSELANRCCQKCGRNIEKKDIIAVGVRQSEKNASLYMEHKCGQCDYREMTNFGGKKEGTIEELCYLLLESVNRHRDTEKSKQIEQKNQGNTGISDKEVHDLQKFIRSAKTHEEFMKYIRADKVQGAEDERENED